ncbi:MAG: hypothetical protein PHH62_00645 [Endomicrobiaceae bacterium]|nr:hypothetical protein [Endomicrobiaceae bacterium]
MNIYKFVFSFLLLFFCQIGYCQTFDISFIDNKILSDISIEFNNTIELHGLKLEVADDKDLLISPYYKSKRNQYVYFSFLDRQFKDSIIAEIKSNKKIYKKDYQNIDYKINKFNIIDNPSKAKAFVSVIFNNLLEVQCTILNGKYGLWVQWPSEKQNNKWKKLFIIKDSNLEYNLEKEILKLYHQKKNKGILQ